MGNSEEAVVSLERLHAVSAKLDNPELALSLLNALPDALVAVDEHAQIMLFNSQAELLFGYTRAEVLGKEIEVLIPDMQRDAHRKQRSVYIEDPRIRPMGIGIVELAGRHKTGRTFPVEVNLAPIMTFDGLFVMAAVRRKKVSDGGRG